MNEGGVQALPRELQIKIPRHDASRGGKGRHFNKTGRHRVNTARGGAGLVDTNYETKLKFWTNFELLGSLIGKGPMLPT